MNTSHITLAGLLVCETIHGEGQPHTLHEHLETLPACCAVDTPLSGVATPSFHVASPALSLLDHPDLAALLAEMMPGQTVSDYLADMGDE